MRRLVYGSILCFLLQVGPTQPAQAFYDAESYAAYIEILSDIWTEVDETSAYLEAMQVALDDANIEAFLDGLSNLFQALGELEGLIEGYYEVLSDYAERYPDYMETTGGITIDKVAAWLQSTRHSTRKMLVLGNQVIDAVHQSNAQSRYAMTQSGVAENELQAEQVTHHFLAVLSQQLNQLNSMQSAFTLERGAANSKRNSTESAVLRHELDVLEGLGEYTGARVRAYR